MNFLASIFSCSFFHFFKKYSYLEKFININWTIDLIKSSDVDIIGISEVFGESQRLELINELKNIGYKYFYHGIGHGLDERYGSVETLITSRLPIKLFYSSNFKVPNIWGYGGGIVAIYLPKHDLYLFQVHLPLSKGERKLYFKNQIGKIIYKIKEIKKLNPKARILIMGDFNRGYSEIIKYFPSNKFSLLSSGVNYPTTNLLKLFYKKSLDHIIGINVFANETSSMQGISDHKLMRISIQL